MLNTLGTIANAVWRLLSSTRLYTLEFFFNYFITEI